MNMKKGLPDNAVENCVMTNVTSQHQQTGPASNRRGMIKLWSHNKIVVKIMPASMIIKYGHHIHCDPACQFFFCQLRPFM